MSLILNTKKSGTAPLEGRDRLWTLPYVLVCLASFLTSFSFFLLVPTLPFYLVKVLGVGQEMVGALLSCYVVAVLCVRPFAGCVADIFPRKRVYEISYLLFAVAFIGYLGFASSVVTFVVLRVFHGFAFGALTTTANTLVIDIMPSSRRGEGLGYYGVMNNLAMAFGPMTGLFIISSDNFILLFAVALATVVLGFILAMAVQTPKKKPQEREKSTSVISLDRFFLISGIPACVAMMLIAVPYGITTSYMAVYAEEVGLTVNSGLFFTVMAFGLIVSRLHSGKMVDRGYITQTISVGMFIALFGVVGETLLDAVAARSVEVANVLYFASALFMGYGYGTIFPAFNTLFVNLAPNSRRATANATYLTGWDVGIGFGMLMGGALSAGGFKICFAVGLLMLFVALLFFVFCVTRHFNAHRVR